MTIAEIVERRGITEVVHFTTGRGLTGVLDTKAVLSRARVKAEERLEYIIQLNCPTVLDEAWEDFVNLSVTRINRSLFKSSSRKWHPDHSWALLAFDPVILEHKGVVFTTTNNAYANVVKRASGPEGLEALFAKRIPWGYYGSICTRGRDMTDNLATDEQAEVLYPESVSTEFLQTIYVAEHTHADAVCAQLALVGHREVTVMVDPTRLPK